MFFFSSVTIQNVQDQSHDLWRYQRFLLVSEYENKNFLPPPFNAINSLVTLTRYLMKRCRKRYRNYTARNSLKFFYELKFVFMII